MAHVLDRIRESLHRDSKAKSHKEIRAYAIAQQMSKKYFNPPSRIKQIAEKEKCLSTSQPAS